MARPIEEIKWQDLEIGAAVSERGSSREYKTGSWRSRLPVVDKDQCIHCGVCWLFCPDAAIDRAGALAVAAVQHERNGSGGRAHVSGGFLPRCSS